MQKQCASASPNSNASISMALRTHDANEGLAAFLEKRQPA